MIHQFLDYISHQNLFLPEEKVLLAISGGMDSVLMAHLFAKAGFKFRIAHCNFKLRGAQSDLDAQLVKELAEKFSVEYFQQDFETESYALKEKISIQMAARDLRYEWLERIRGNNDLQYIATAHHLNDSIETVVYNFSKGCGIRGLHGILPKKDKIIRPLLFSSREEIEQFIQTNKIEYREDASNASEKYSRNFIRHQIIPKLKELNPAFEKSSQDTIKNIRETEFLFNQSIANYKKKLVRTHKGELIIDYTKLPQEAAHTILFEILHPLGFHGDQVKMILDQDHQSGITFYSESHILLINRDHYIVKKNEVPSLVNIQINATEEAVLIKDKTLLFETINQIPKPIPKDASIAILDYDKLTFPLHLRPWKAGDVFQPFGMNGKHQKVKEFLTNKKLSRFEKEKIHVIENNGEICWVVGMRIDERFRITEKSNRVYQIKLV